jgi:hypothetical protein
MIALAILIVYIYYQLLAGEALDALSITILIFTIVVIVGPVIGMIGFGTKYNDIAQTHFTIILTEQISLQHMEITQDFDKKESARIQRIENTISSAKDLMEVLDQRYVVTVFGFTAGSTLLKSLLAVAASGILTVVQLVVN